jgi:hypothetical protein
MRTPIPIATIQLDGPNTFHNREVLSVVPDSESAIHGIPGMVTIEQAKALVGRGDAIWIKPLPGPFRPTDQSTHEGVTAR